MFCVSEVEALQHGQPDARTEQEAATLSRLLNELGLGAFAASELDKVFSGYQPR
jgi:hypothetical protein